MNRHGILMEVISLTVRVLFLLCLFSGLPVWTKLIFLIVMIVLAIAEIHYRALNESESVDDEREKMIRERASNNMGQVTNVLLYISIIVFVFMDYVIPVYFLWVILAIQPVVRVVSGVWLEKKL